MAKVLVTARSQLHERRGRKPMAAPAWEMMPFALDTPPQHPQQDAAILLGIPVAADANLAVDLVVE